MLYSKALEPHGRRTFGSRRIRCAGQYGKYPENSNAPADESHEGLIPANLRKYVSRWGFDPVWDDVAFGPLTLDDFTNAVDLARYDNLAEATNADVPPIGVALHSVNYQSHNDLWYADIAIRAPDQGMPFVQLALVRYQRNGLPSLKMRRFSWPIRYLTPVIGG